MTKPYSGKQVIRAGEVLMRDDKEHYNWAMDVLSYWRSQHEGPLDTALEMVKIKAKKIDNKVFFGKRLKRTPSIINKLRRFEERGMKLKNMQDIGGCRVIVSSTKKLHRLIKELRKCPEFKNGNNQIKCSDYISNPKPDGYRSYHLIGNFTDQTNNKKKIEVQLRTRLQHDWATTLEIVELFTGEALKSNGGNQDFQDFFAQISEQLSVMESIHIFDQLKEETQYQMYLQLVEQSPKLQEKCIALGDLAKRIRIAEILHGFTESLKMSEDVDGAAIANGFILLMVDLSNNTLTYEGFSESQGLEAEQAYTNAEKQHSENPAITIALVSANAVGGIKEAYPNYFADSHEFLKYLTYVSAVGKQLQYKRTILGRLFNLRTSKV